MGELSQAETGEHDGLILRSVLSQRRRQIRPQTAPTDSVFSKYLYVFLYSVFLYAMYSETLSTMILIAESDPESRYLNNQGAVLWF